MSNVESLRKTRTHLKGTATRLENFLNQVTNETSLFEIRARLERLEKIYDSFQALDIEMSTHNGNIPERDAELEEFENRYYKMKTKYCEIIDARLHNTNIVGDHLNSTTVQQDAMQKLLESQAVFLEKLSALQATSTVNQESVNTSVQSADVRLPKLNIPVFDGNYSEFRSFFDLFNSSVHSNYSLTASQKFQYLKGLLKGEPAMLIRHLAVSDQNYTEAIKKIEERYDKPSLVIDSLIETLLLIPKANNPQSLRNVSNVADEVIRGLRAQGPDAEKRDPWLIHILLKKVDRDSHKSWAEHYSKTTFPTLESFIKFMNDRCDALERMPTPDDKNRMSKSVRSYTSFVKRSCSSCSQNHHLAYCPTFSKMTVPNRIEFVKEKRLCFNCLKPGHIVQNCPSKHVCESCKAHHHSCIHLERNSKSVSANTVKSTTSKEVKNSKEATLKSKTVVETASSSDPSNSSFYVPSSSSNTSINLAASFKIKTLNMLLPTAKVLVKDNMGCFHRCNILLDSGCQNTLISESCANRLGLKRNPSKIYVCGLGNNKAGSTKGIVEVQLKSLYNSDSIVMQAHVFKYLTSKLPPSPLTINYWDEVKNLSLADPDFDTPKDIDILVGYDYFFTLLREGQILKDGVLLAQNTIFGYVLCGGSANANSINASYMEAQDKSEVDLNHTLKLFWETESVPQVTTTMTPEDQQAEDFYQSTTIRTERYSVRLPFIHNAILGNSYSTALSRIKSMERKFKSNPELKKAYTEFINEYIVLGHMKPVSSSKLNLPAERVCYLPHHAVLKDNSLTTKLRVVFDGSAKTSNGRSLNDNLLKGPTLQQDLLGVILRYRCKKYCFSADIKQMFRMIQVQECDQGFQRVLWRESPDDEIQHYQLTTVTYGTRPAPYLSIRTLLQLSDDERNNYPLASEAVKSSFYVDDCMAGSNTLAEAKELAEQLNNLLRAGGFILRKWASNDSRILSQIPDSAKIERIVDIPSELTVCLLGIIWNPMNDSFSYKVKTSEYHLDTKRHMLSEISKIYDPLGWISPVIVAVKIIIQQLWLSKLEWDDLLPKKILDEVKLLFSEFHLLNNINIPRLIFSTENDISFHGFCDASTLAYAAVIYCRKISADGQVSTNIVLSKTKVAPIASLSIPRLELCAAYLLCQLFEYLALVINIKLEKALCWTDSKTVLAWLSSHPSKWKTFICHRSSHILENLPSKNWRYVPSKDNPADVASRGVKSSALINNELWFKGPSWLIQEEIHWPQSKGNQYTTNEEIRPNQQVALISSTDDNPDIVKKLTNKISCWPKLIRGRATITNKKLRKLSPFLDSDEILRVGGRLSKSDLPYDCKHQIILHKDCPIVRKIVHDLHLRNLHAKITLLIATLRQKYWIIGAREIVKTVTQQCGVCIRYSARTQQQLMGTLPKFRVTASYPFYEVGCDYAGPILYKQHNGRKAPIVKAYVAVFICLVTKAVHLELVSDLSTDAFLAALDRFVARRGLCAHIHSDNRTNFQGAAKKLNQIHNMVKSFNLNHEISNFLSSKGIPPSAPHFGGVWESSVKSMKYHLRRTVGQATLNFEELSTLLSRIEAILNSRPLVQADADDIPYLTPGHFLVGRPLNALPEADVTHLKSLTLSKWRVVQQLTQYFWSRWSTDYLLSLQPRSKWLTEKENLKIDDIVLLREDNQPPSCWKISRVIETHAGTDGLVRVATVKTSNSIFKRPVTKLYPLPKDC